MGGAESCLACDSKRSNGEEERKPERMRVTPRNSGKALLSDDDMQRVGIGAYFQRSKEPPHTLQIKSLLKGSPAEACKAIAIGDHIIKVNGEEIQEKTLAELAERLLGVPGTSVECTFTKGSSGSQYSVSLTRATVA